MNPGDYTNPVSLKCIRIDDPFWNRFTERIIRKVLPYQWEALNDRLPDAAQSYCIRNFKIAAQITHPELDYGADTAAGHGGFVFQDSDLAKWIEAAAYTLIGHPDPKLEETIDDAVALICNAQQSDGYLNTYYIITGLEKRFTNLKDNHELYCLGHFIEAAVAYYEATGKRGLLDAVIRYVDCADRLIGPEPEKLRGYPGHEIIEMALIRLYRITNDEKHLKLAKYFIDERGREPLFFEEEEKKRGGTAGSGQERCFRYQYYQADKPVREQRVAVGHAVRAVYLYSGMADVARLTGDAELFTACEELFADIAKRQMYITGGIGQTCHGEAFSYDYDLPNDTVYAETCASIGLAFFARRMSGISPKRVYADVLEKTLYNGIISGMSLDSKTFFYVNPLEVIPESSEKDPRMKHIKTDRQKWFSCACCPPNLARIIASLGNYVHSANADSIYTHLYIGGEAEFLIENTKCTLKIETQYPWDGQVAISFVFKEPQEKAEFRYGFRTPSWCKSYQTELNGETIFPEIKNGYALIRRFWQNGDKLKLNFDMPVQVIEANPQARQNAGKVAVMRGPLVYCLEEADNGKELFKIRLGKPQDFTVQYKKDFLEGVAVIECTAKKVKDWNDDELYRAWQENEYEKKRLRFIPYYAWSNRGTGAMTVWIHI
jgi:DUF1680 family protein